VQYFLAIALPVGVVQFAERTVQSHRKLEHCPKIRMADIAASGTHRNYGGL